MVDETGNVVVVVVAIMVRRVRSSSSFKEVWPRTTGGVGAVDTVVHFSSIIIAGSCPTVRINVPIVPRPNPAPNKADPNITFFQ